MKNKIRNKKLAMRNALEKAFVIESEKKVFDLLSRMDIYKNSNYIMAYLDFKNEIKTQLLINDIMSDKKLLVPLTDKHSLHMKPIPINSMEELVAGNFGVLEPLHKRRESFNKSLIDLVIIPGVVFDLTGNRIGFGKGYYDTFLSSLESSIPFVSLAYDFQVMDHIPSEGHDVQMDYIITPTRIIECKKFK